MQLNLFPEDREAQKRSLIYGTPEFRNRYNEALRSPYWKKLRVQVCRRANKRCEKISEGVRCPNIPRKLEVHHLHYNTLGQELLSDVIGLCPMCHAAADLRRKQDSEAAYIAAGKAARLANWQASYLETKYGEDAPYLIMADPEGMDREFDDWRRRKSAEDDEVTESYYDVED